MAAHQQQANTVIASSVHDEIHTPPLPISNPTAAAAVDYLKPVNICLMILLGAFPVSYFIFMIYGEFGKHPPALPNCYVDSVILYPFNVSSSHITAYWNTSFFFSVKNSFFEDTVSIYLHDVQASVFYKDTILSSATIRPIFANVDHLVEANIGVSSGYLNTSIGDSMVSDWSLGAINFNIKVNALVLQIIEDETKTIKRLRTSFSCENVTIGFADGKNWAGTMIGGSRDCIKYP